MKYDYLAKKNSVDEKCRFFYAALFCGKSEESEKLNFRFS